MNNYFLNVKDTLLSTNPTQKFYKFQLLNEDFYNEKVNFMPLENIEIFTEPSYKNICNIVHTSAVPKRERLDTKEGIINLLHAVAHIEYSAIDLALDACYRFQNMPYEFYKDWMEVADDEIRHFIMIEKLLGQYGKKYGDYDVHQGLFDASMKTLELIPRMALIPRYMEANGLDANMMIINKLKNIPNTQEIVEALEVILEEEVDHVKKGDFWYKYGCNKKENFSCDYFKIVNNIYPNSFKKNKHINVEARIKAGFSNDEIAKLKSY